ncbi:MAG: oligosaccharide flippase family protein [Kofleriaceae bacterium]|nr:oligosaccharide flippase family protein [Myxococcales bacterium]MCB9561549.1 oligosaccharide flippase family protein [Kofleriaceae bacterium]MCB9572266.1 oligosaccharide flippase family protein [Kofleriaceae bacterium]
MSDDAKLRKQVARGVAWSGASQAIIAIADLVSQVLVLALWVPASDYGVAGVVLGLYTVFDYAVDLGVAPALIQRDDHTPEKVSTVFWFNLIMSGVLCLILAGLGPLLAMAHGHRVIGWLLFAYSGKLLLQNGFSIPMALLKKELRFAEVAKIRLVAHLAESVARIVFASMGWTIWCFTLAILTRAAVAALMAFWFHPFVPKLVFRPREVSDYVKFGARSTGSQLLYQLYVNMDYQVVSLFFGSAATGIYRMAYEVILEPVRTITNVMTDVAFPAFARMRHEPKKLHDQLIRFTRLNLVAVLPFLVVIALVGPEIMTLLFSGKEHPPEQLQLAGEIARILSFVGVLRALGYLGPPLLDGIGRPDLTLRYMITATLIVPTGFVLFAWLLGPVMGVHSVALAWTVFYPIAFGVLAYQVVKTTALPVGAYLRASAGIAACALIAGVVGLGTRVLVDGLGTGARFGIVAGVTVVVMLTLLVTWQGFTPRSLKASLAGDPPA